MHGMMDIGRICSLYNKVCSALLLALTVVWGLLSQLMGLDLWWILTISVLFHAACYIAYIQGWRAVARRSPDVLPKYYLAGSAFRLMAAAIVLLVVCVVKRVDIDAIRWFAIVFIVYYLVMLIFDAIFFAKVSKKQ